MSRINATNPVVLFLFYDLDVIVVIAALIPVKEDTGVEKSSFGPLRPEVNNALTAMDKQVIAVPMCGNPRGS